MSPVVAPGLHRGDAAHQRFIGDLDEPLGAARNLADEIHAARIAVPAVDDQGHVDVDDVAVAQRLAIGNAVADDVVDRGADRLAVAAIVERRRIGAMRQGEVEDQLVEQFGGHAGPDMLGEQVEDLGRQRPALRMPSKAAGPCNLICPVLRPGTSRASTNVMDPTGNEGFLPASRLI